MTYAPFSVLSLGAKFKYDSRKHGPQNRVYVKIYPNLIAEWDITNLTTNWTGQQVFCFTDSDDPEDWKELVEVIEQQ